MEVITDVELTHGQQSFHLHDQSRQLTSLKQTLACGSLHIFQRVYCSVRRSSQNTANSGCFDGPVQVVKNLRMKVMIFAVIEKRRDRRNYFDSSP